MGTNTAGNGNNGQQQWRWHSTHPKPASDKFMFTIIKNRNAEIFINCAKSRERVRGLLAKWKKKYGKGLTMCRAHSWFRLKLLLSLFTIVQALRCTALYRIFLCLSHPANQAIKYTEYNIYNASNNVLITWKVNIFQRYSVANPDHFCDHALVTVLLTYR